VDNCLLSVENPPPLGRNSVQTGPPRTRPAPWVPIPVTPPPHIGFRPLTRTLVNRLSTDSPPPRCSEEAPHTVPRISVVPTRLPHLRHRTIPRRRCPHIHLPYDDYYPFGLLRGWRYLGRSKKETAGGGLPPADAGVRPAVDLGPASELHRLHDPVDGDQVGGVPHIDLLLE
jgi:hypothetical protein